MIATVVTTVTDSLPWTDTEVICLTVFGIISVITIGFICYVMKD